MDKITQILENVVRCKYCEAGVHIKNPIKNSYQDDLGRTTKTSDHVVVVHILIWDMRKSQINEYSDICWIQTACTFSNAKQAGGQPEVMKSNMWHKEGDQRVINSQQVQGQRQSTVPGVLLSLQLASPALSSLQFYNATYEQENITTKILGLLKYLSV